MRAVKGDGEVGVAAGAEDDGLQAALVDGAIADEEDVSVDEAGIGGEDLLEVGRAGFFFTFPDEADVGVERDVGGTEGVEGGELGEDGGLVITGGAGVDALLAVDLAQGWGEGRGDVPLGGGDGLAVVMGVEDDGVLGAGSVDLAEDDGRRAGEGEQARVDVALGELREEEVGVAAETGGIGGDVGDGEEAAELVDEVGAMGSGVSLGGLGGCLAEGLSEAEQGRCGYGRDQVEAHGANYTGGCCWGWGVVPHKFCAAMSKWMGAGRHDGGGSLCLPILGVEDSNAISADDLRR